MHWKAVKRVMRYLNGTKNYKLTLVRNHDSLFGYADANWTSQDHRYSISDRWRKYFMELSKAEHSHIALTHATKEALWLQNFITEVI